MSEIYLVINFSRKAFDNYKRTLEHPDMNDVRDAFVLKDTAYDCSGVSIRDCCSLHVKNNNDCPYYMSRFWSTFNKIIENEKEGVK